MEKRTSTSYFAAANGYDGFRSYFKSIFNSKEFQKVVVLKGGPGTGKSSIMKKISKYYSEKGFNSDNIYCSSDSNSLDGVIIENENIRAAILDGTAPHQRDAEIPGVIDKIINLGDCWDERKLSEKRKEILDLNDQKSHSYTQAYKFLSLSGIFKNEEISTVEKNFYFEDAKRACESILSKISNIKCGSKEKVRLISCFGKDGYKQISESDVYAKTYYSVSGKFSSEYVFMSLLLKTAREKNIPITVFPSPLSERMTEALLIGDSEMFITTHKNYENNINSFDFADEKSIVQEKENIELYENIYKNLIEISQAYFSKASEYHFALESIYTPLMNFDKINEITEKIINEFDTLFKSAK